MKIAKSTVAVCAILALMAPAGTAAAADAVHASVTIPNGQPTPIVTKQNGSGLTAGNYAIGTIQLFYTVQAFEFPTGTFAKFNLGLGLEPVSGQAPVYPVSLTLVQKQEGTENLIITPDTAAFNLLNASWTDSTLVTIGIPSGVSNDDGTDLVGLLQIEATDTRVKTTTKIQVHIKLVHPTTCVKLYNFITDEAFTGIVTSTDIVVKNNTVKSTNPGNFSDNVLVVNTCSVPQTLDVKVSLDPWFRTNPYENPGNAVFAFTTSGETGPDTFDIAAFGTGTAQGQSLSFSDITVEGGEMFLLTVHMSIYKKAAWTGGTSGTFGGFSAGLYVSGSGFTTPLGDVVAPNPASAALGYTVK